jgi:hypothetical protein
MMDSVSEIGQLMQQIELECEAMRLAMMGFRTIASHDIINHQFDRLGEHYEQFGELIGQQAAIEVVIMLWGEVSNASRICRCRCPSVVLTHVPFPEFIAPPAGRVILTSP